MAHRTHQNVPLHNGTRRPISPTGPICTSPRLTQTHNYMPGLADMQNQQRLRTNLSPTKQTASHALPNLYGYGSPVKQHATLTPIDSNSSLEWTHSVSDFSRQAHGLLGGQPSIFGNTPLNDNHAAFSNPASTVFNPPIVDDSSMIGLSSSKTANRSTIDRLNTPTTGLVAVIDDDDELPHDLFDDPKVAPALSGGLVTRQFETTFNVYQLIDAEPENVPSQSRKRTRSAKKAPPKPSRPQWKNFRPIVPVIHTLPVGSFSWDDYREKIFNACNLRLAGISKALVAAHETGHLAIHAFIKGTDRNHKSYGGYITDDNSFSRLIVAVLAAPADAHMGFKITHPNPKNNEEVTRCVRRKIKGFPSLSEAEDSESAGVSSLS
ncbi:uncharacterized protein MELLADRAFT_95513 [Melampsora larici-populina 98AG31]|uniref:Uncharacterized protein n=1 Tax=Melampsora larici-populina (strain 98AG31 / pathotype 3-4-7) TaxID=747676 RepID=F4S9L8_MELLP|nr:uncharacterized protein MELLADRAFT_95513 [Melampsora larici-populina 98AG31]EGF98660.1 hypothetical protein MELLADRAFT_95513 [Melampsora larici-populina 98AG31]